MAQDPPPHTLHKLDGLERKKVKVIVQSPLIPDIQYKGALAKTIYKEHKRHKTIDILYLNGWLWVATGAEAVSPFTVLSAGEGISLR